MGILLPLSDTPKTTFSHKHHIYVFWIIGHAVGTEAVAYPPFPSL